ncbi:MAG: Spy/CpxP family protein refolding chaperone [Xanthobacteraceae bacterium]
MRLKTIFAGTTVLALAGATLVYAQQRQQNPGDYSGGAAEQSQGQRDPDQNSARPPRDRFSGFSREDRAAFLSARIAALKAGLELTPEQEKNWPAFETALRNLDTLRASRIAARRDNQPPANGIEGLRRQADVLSSTGAALRQLADAEEPLLNGLNDEQKRRFVFFTHRQMEFGRFAAGGYAGPRGPDEERGLDGPPGRRDGDHTGRDEWRERIRAEHPDGPGMDWRGRRGSDDPGGRDAWLDRRGPGSTNGIDGHGAGDLEADDD